MSRIPTSLDAHEQARLEWEVYSLWLSDHPELKDATPGERFAALEAERKENLLLQEGDGR